MLKRFTLALLLVFTLWLSAFAGAQFAKTCSITGASAQKLSTILVDNGFGGTASLSGLTLKNPVAATGNLCFGGSTVATTGDCLLPGDSYTFPAVNQADGIDASQLYLYVSSTQNAFIVARSK